MPPYIAMAATAGAVFLALEGDDLGPLLFTLIVLPIGLLAVASRITISGAPYVLGIIVPVVWLVGVAVDRILAASSGRARWGAAILVSGLLLAQAGDLVLYHTVYNGLKPRWHEASTFVDANRKPGDVVVAAEADVVGYYIGYDGVSWYSVVEDQIASGEFPPASAPGAWYVIYMADDPLTPGWREARARLEKDADLRLLLPLHYGPKDRTLGVFYAPGARTDEVTTGP